MGSGRGDSPPASTDGLDFFFASGEEEVEDESGGDAGGVGGVDK